MHMSTLRLCIIDALFPHTIVVPNQKLCIMTIIHYNIMHYEIIDCISIDFQADISAILPNFQFPSLEDSGCNKIYETHNFEFAQHSCFQPKLDKSLANSVQYEVHRTLQFVPFYYNAHLFGYSD